MQLITLLAYIEAPPTLRASGDTQTAAFTAQVAAYKHEDPPMLLAATVWGDAAAKAAANIRAGSYWILSGRFRIETGQPLEFQVEKFDAVSAPVDLAGTNRVALVGRAGRDPEARYFESGSMVANLTLAVNRRSRDDKPDWFNLEIWGNQAQVAADYVRKGSLLGITGSFKLDRWTDRSTGEERTKPVINVDMLTLLGSKRDAEGGTGAGGYSAPGYGGPASDEEVPF
jgi:single-strand DNA-binding protein